MSILATSMLVIIAREKAFENTENGENPRSNLAQVSYIQYSIVFNRKSVLALFDSDNKVDSIYPTFAKELGLPIIPTDIRVLKIDSIMLDTDKMVVVAFLVMDKTKQVKFFKENFLVANVSLEVVFRMLFLTLINADIDFLD